MNGYMKLACIPQFLDLFHPLLPRLFCKLFGIPYSRNRLKYRGGVLAGDENRPNSNRTGKRSSSHFINSNQRAAFHYPQYSKKISTPFESAAGAVY